MTAIIYPAYGDDATFAMVTNTASALHGVQNLADLVEITTVFRASGSGATAFSFVLAEDRIVAALALCRHNATPGATLRIRLYSDTGLSVLVYDSTATAMTTDASGLFAQVEVRTFDPVTIRGGLISLSSIGKAWQIGGMAVGEAWDLSAASAIQTGLKAQDSVLEVGDGATHRAAAYAPRTATVGLSVIDWTTDGVTLQDFHDDIGTDKAFVYARDLSVSSTAFLARNSSLTDLTKGGWIYGSLGLSLIEHLQ